MLSFASSPQSTLGAEWELAIVDAEDFSLASRAPEILEALKAEGTDHLQGKIVGEMLTNTVEIVSGVQTDVAGITADLSATLDYLRNILAPRGLDVMCAGTHPFSPWWEQEVTPAYRYEELVNRTQWWGRQMLIFGVHTHVGIANRDHVMPIVRALMAYVPHLEAVSASSPYWAGHDTHYASNRAMLFQQLPTAGLPFQLKNWAEYEDYIGDMLHTGVVDSINEIRWDISPAPGWGTVEIRVCDGIPTVAELAAVTAFVQCLVHDMSQRLDRGEELNFLPDWFHAKTSGAQLATAWTRSSSKTLPATNVWSRTSLLTRWSDWPRSLRNSGARLSWNRCCHLPALEPPTSGRRRYLKKPAVWKTLPVFWLRKCGPENRLAGKSQPHSAACWRSTCSSSGHAAAKPGCSS